MGDLERSNRKILVVVEREDKEIAPITFELITIGKKISTVIQGTNCAVVLGNEISSVSDEIASYAEEVYSISHTLLGQFQAEAYASSLEQLCQNLNFDIVLIGHTLNGLDLAPRLAYKIGAQIVTDCIQISLDQETGHLFCVKPVYGAKIFSLFELKRKPCIVTIRPKVMDAGKPNPDLGKIVHIKPNIDKSTVRVDSIKKVVEENISLDKADAIVAGGRGVKDSEGLKELQKLAVVLNKWFNKVELGASRPLVDLGLVSSSRQVGLTGQKVAPELYIAVGISGSLQHLTGMLGSKKVIAINNNPKAPIFGVAHYGVVGNFEDVLPFFRKKLEDLM
jgi:electron transfer flavoprotein alpha subunit